MRTDLLPIIKAITSVVLKFLNFAAKAVGFAGRLWDATIGQGIRAGASVVQGLIGGDGTGGGGGEVKADPEVIALFRRTANGIEHLQMGTAQ